MPGKSKAEQVLTDNPDAMHDLMQKIRADPNYVTSLYKSCPGMKKVLDEHPDLKKIFENPDIMRRSFEAVYIKNGGQPEPVDEDDSDYESDTDEDDYESSYGGSHGGKAFGDAGTLATEDFDDDDTLARQKKALKKKKAEEKAARDPSKAVKFLSKLAGVRGIVIIIMSFMSPFKIVRKLGEVFFEGDIEPPSGDAALAADACNAAAEHFDDPAVAEEMDRLLEENPDNLDEIVENDETLRNLRDSDPIAAELMRDPETFKVITDGENLRAMGELTQAMEGDFVNGLEGGGGVDAGVDAGANAMDALDTADGAGDAGDAFDAADYEEPDLDEENGEDGGAAQDAEEYLQDAEMEDDDMKKSGRRGQRGKGKNQRNRTGEAAQGAKGLLGAGISAVAGGFLGDTMGDMMDFGGGEDLTGVAGEDMVGLEDVAADTDLVDAADAAEAVQDAGEGLATEELMVMGAAGGAVVAAGAVGGAYVMSRDDKNKDGTEGGEVEQRGQQDGNSGDEDEGKKNKGMFGKLKSGAGNIATFVADTAKETLVTTVLGDDMGEAMIEAKDGVEEAKEELGSDSEKESDDDGDDSRRDNKKDHRDGGQQQHNQQGRQRSSRGQRYEEHWDDGDNWNYERQGWR